MSLRDIFARMGKEFSSTGYLKTSGEPNRTRRRRDAAKERFDLWGTKHWGSRSDRPTNRQRRAAERKAKRVRKISEKSRRAQRRRLH